MLYQREMGECSVGECVAAFDLEPYLKAGGPTSSPEPRRKRVADAFRHARKLLEGTLERRDEIDELIRGQADNWRLERMPAVDRNILRLAVYEMLFDADTPRLVAVDEAIDLAKRFGSEQSSRFVNGLLDGLLKEQAASSPTAAQKVSVRVGEKVDVGGIEETKG